MKSQTMMTMMTMNTNTQKILIPLMAENGNSASPQRDNKKKPPNGLITITMRKEKYPSVTMN